MRDVVPAIKKFLDDNTPRIDEVLALYSHRLHKVFDYESANVPSDMLPCIEIGNGRVEKTYIATQYHVQLRYEIELKGYLLYDDTEKNAQAMRAFVTVVSDLFEDAIGETLPIIDGSTPDDYVHYGNEPPLTNYELDYSFIGEAFVRMWSATWIGYVSRPQRRNEPLC